jgi:hypothetical protein
VTLLAMSPLLLAVLLGVKSYEVWPQIIYLWDIGADPLTEIAGGNPHALRYNLIYPILVISDQLGLDYDRLFTAVVLFICFFTIRNIHSISTLIAGSSRNAVLSQFATSAFMTVLFFNMNGRISLAFLGYTIILMAVFSHHYQREFTFGSLVKVLVGLLLASVSSGTIVSVALAFLIGVYFEVFRIIRRGTLTRSSIVIFSSSVVLGLLLFRFLVAGIKKNIAYYGGGDEGVLRMLQHGFGQALFPTLNAIGLPSVILLVLVVAALSSLLMFQMRHGLLFHLLMAAIACGTFGHSTLSLTVVPLMVVFSVYLAGRPSMPRATNRRSPAGLIL